MFSTSSPSRRAILLQLITISRTPSRPNRCEMSALDAGAVRAPRLSQTAVRRPSAGNLLLDVRNFTGGISARPDASDVDSDPISRVYTNPGAGAVDTPTGFANSSGLVTRFTVPEPSATGLELAALGTLAALFTRRARCGALGGGKQRTLRRDGRAHRRTPHHERR